MSKRQLNDWLKSYVDYASVTEAPKKMHFWTGISVLAGAVRRKVWVEQVTFRWYANLYIIFVADPGVVTKSTTMDMGMNLLRAVPGIQLGPSSVTWPALVKLLADSQETFEYRGKNLPMAAITLASSEMGSLIQLQDTDMINTYVDLWDGKDAFEKITKMSGCDYAKGVWINLIACTTPHYIKETLPTIAVGGGFTSRCVFVHAEKKERFVPFVDEVIRPDFAEFQETLVNDLTYIANNLVGPVKISAEARDWYRPVYEKLWKTAENSMDSGLRKGYVARKQSMTFKLAMLLSISKGDSLVIDLEDVQLAEVALTEIEEDMNKIFSGVGKGTKATEASRFIEFIRRKGAISYEEAYRQVYKTFPDIRDFESIMYGAVKSGQIEIKKTPQGVMLSYRGF